MSESFERHSMQLNLRYRNSKNIRFRVGEDVFVPFRGKLFLGTVAIVQTLQCCVKIGNVEEWYSNSQIQRLCNADDSDSESEDDLPICPVCQNKYSFEEVGICEICYSEYHQECAGTSSQKSNSNCPECSRQNSEVANNSSIEIINLVDEDDSAQYDEEKDTLIDDETDKIKNYTTKDQLPYVLMVLKWDENHRVNKEGIYCYCGKTGVFTDQMLQCAKCRQWFHLKCTRFNKIPMLKGDMFFFFCCSICNMSHQEYIARLEMTWEEVCHLVMYNLTANYKTKFVCAFSGLRRYIQQNWDNLMLSKEMAKIRYKEPVLNQKIFEALSNSNKFKSGVEQKRKHDTFALRRDAPPFHNREYPEQMFKMTLSDYTLQNFGVRFIETPFILDTFNYRLDKVKSTNNNNKTSNEDTKVESESVSIVKNGDGKAPLQLNNGSIQPSNGILTTSQTTEQPFINTRIRKRADTIAAPLVSKTEKPKRKFNPGSNRIVSSELNLKRFRPEKPASILDMIPRPNDYSGTNNPFHRINLPTLNRKTIKIRRYRLIEDTKGSVKGIKRKKQHSYQKVNEYMIYNNGSKYDVSDDRGLSSSNSTSSSSLNVPTMSSRAVFQATKADLRQMQYRQTSFKRRRNSTPANCIPPQFFARRQSMSQEVFDDQKKEEDAQSKPFMIGAKRILDNGKTSYLFCYK